MHIGLRSRLHRNLAEDTLIGLIFQAIGGMTRSAVYYEGQGAFTLGTSVAWHGGRDR